MNGFEILYTFLCGVYISLAIHHFSVYAGRKNDRNNLYYTILVLSCAYITVVKGILPGTSLFSSPHLRHLVVFAQYTSSSFAICAMLYFINTALDLKKIRKYVYLYTVSMIIFISACYIWYLLSGDAYTPIKAIVILTLPPGAGLWILMLAVFFSKGQEHLRDGNKKIISISSIAYCSSYIIFPIMYLRGYPLAEQLLVITIGMIIMAISSSLALIKQFNDEHHELIATKAHLEERVDARTKELQIAIKEKTSSFVNLAHETRTPATLIQNYLDKFISRNPCDKDLLIVKKNVNKLVRDMTNFLDTEKIEQGRLVYEKMHRINLTDYINDTADLVEPSAASLGIRLVRKLSPGVEVTSNVYALDRILNNLLDNAMRYTPGGGEIRLELEAADSTDFIKIKVIDTGNGIPKEMQQHIFDKYYQISHKKGNTQGMGMGLYIVKGIVEGMGGKISLESDEKGTCFTVKIPSGPNGESLSLSDFKISSSFTITTDNPSFENTNIDCNKKTVLLVEDNRELILSMRESLIPEYNVLCASNGKDALDLLGKFNTDLIVSDVMMDTMDGYELLKRVRENDQMKGIPFIFLTAKSGISEELKGLTSGAIDYIPKPFTMDLLTARICSLLEYNALKSRTFELEKYRSVGMLTAGICHEILNPLSGIRGPLYVIEKSTQELVNTSDNTLTKSIGFIKENVSRIESIVNTMRSLFHGESFSVENIELHSFLTPIVEIFKNRTGENISYELNVPPGLEIKTNQGAFSRIIMNLLSNAVESINETGKIQIEMDSNVLVIRDSGCGIQKEQLSKIFNLAFTTKKESGGTGLGLYLVKELADRLSITIEVRSEVGRGTEVLLGLGKHFRHENRQNEGK